MEENTPATNTAQPEKKSSRLAILCILIAGSLWGCLGLFNRNLSALGIAPETVVMLRNLGACVILAILFLIYDRSIFRIRLRHLPLFLAMGLVSILLFTLCYFRSQQVSSLAVAAILFHFTLSHFLFDSVFPLSIIHFRSSCIRISHRILHLFQFPSIWSLRSASVFPPHSAFRARSLSVLHHHRCPENDASRHPFYMPRQCSDSHFPRCGIYWIPQTD